MRILAFPGAATSGPPPPAEIEIEIEVEIEIGPTSHGAANPTRVADRRVICNGNVEKLRSTLGRESIIAWHFGSFTRKRTAIRRWAADPDGPPVVLLRPPAATRRWLESLGPVAP